MIAFALMAVMAAGPALESRVLIATGAKTKAEAEALQQKVTVPTELVLSPGYPKLVESKTLVGLNPGFFLVVLGVCADKTDDDKVHVNGLSSLMRERIRGAYAKPIGKQPEACPVWIEQTETPVKPSTIEAVKKKPNDLKALLALALEQRETAAIIGPAILTRRAIALGAKDEKTLELSKTVEFILEDVPDQLPR